MDDYFERFKNSPATFKKGFALLVIAWFCHLFYTYFLFWSHGTLADASGDIKKMAVVSLSLCFFLFLIKKWARALVVMGSFFVVVYDLIWFVATPPSPISTLLCVVIVLFTIIGTYFLFTKKSRYYFTAINPKPEKKDPLT